MTERIDQINVASEAIAGGDLLEVQNISNTAEHANGTSEKFTVNDVRGQQSIQCTFWPNSEGAINSEALGRGLGAMMPVAGTITKVYWSTVRVITASDTDYWTLDVRKIGTAGGATGTSLVATPNTTKATGGLFAGSTLQSQRLDLGVDQNLTVAAGDLIYAYFVKTLSPATLNGRGHTLIIEYTPS